MSELKVNSIKGVGASTAAITVNNSDGTCTANITDRPNRNLIINGAMAVAQRGTSSTSDGYKTVDRFQIDDGGQDESITREQVAVTSGGAYTAGFRKCLKITNGNQTGGAGSTDYIQVSTKLEAQNVASSGWNYTSTSSYITLSFWLKSSVAQAFSGSLRTYDGTGQSYKFDTPSLSANTWTKVTKTIPGNSNLQFDTDTLENSVDKGLQLYLYPFIGTNYTTSNSDTETWVTSSSGNYANDMTSTWWTTNDATWELTGLKLEVSNVATDFIFRSFQEDLKLCERYFHMSYNTGRTIGSTGSGGGVQHNGTNNHAGTCQMNLNYPVEMRANPTLVAYSGDTGNSGNWTGTSNSASLGDRSTTFYLTNTKRTSIYINTGGSRVACGMVGHYTADAEL